MKSNISFYRCTSCGSSNIISDASGLTCSDCKSFYKFDITSGCYNFLTKEESNDLLLQDLNLGDLEDEEALKDDTQFRLYSEEHYLQSDYAQNLVKEFNLRKGALILDHGCGRGHFSKMFTSHGYEVASADILEESISGLDSDKKAICNLAKLPYKDNTFDGVFSLDVFEHLIPETMDMVISEIFRVLKPGGVLLISFPGNRIPDYIGIHIINIFVFIIRLFGSKYPYMRSNKIPAHINLQIPLKFQRAFKRAGFTGHIKPYTNKFMTLPRKFVFLAKLLNFRLIAPFFVSQMHGLLEKPKDQ